MTEQTSFEARAVIAPSHRRLSRLALLLPAVALVVTVWAGSSGPRSNQSIAELLDQPTAAPSGPVARVTPAVVPTQVIGLPVQRLDQVPTQTLGRNDDVAVAGWYVATTISGCPPLAAFYRAGSPLKVGGDIDAWRFCDRSGVLYASQPDVRDSSSRGAALLGFGVTIIADVIVPPELEILGADATQVVVIGRFLEPGNGCRALADCPRELVVDHVAWTPGA